MARLSAAFALFAAGLLSFSAFAGAEEGLIWTDKSGGDVSTLAYGPLDPAADPVFMVSCFNGMDIVVLDVHKEIPGAKSGQPIAIELSSAKAKVPIQGEVSVNDATGKTFGEASDIKLKPVLDVLGDSGAVTLKLGDASFTLSEQGRAEALQRFSQNCEVK